MAKGQLESNSFDQTHCYLSWPLSHKFISTTKKYIWIVIFQCNILSRTWTKFSRAVFSFWDCWCRILRSRYTRILDCKPLIHTYYHTLLSRSELKYFSLDTFFAHLAGHQYQKSEKIRTWNFKTQLKHFTVIISMLQGYTTKHFQVSLHIFFTWYLSSRRWTLKWGWLVGLVEGQMWQ